ncbi:carbohydrate ABC transporter permease [Paenibacillus sp. F411]|uniref:carbohydrate ABC transporter permease n=1 Tax=Paenibacillus sp. F411 TaxID=2820239 RepID=UPI001AAF23A5|nr:carbohydrate ABC transporter permease [Paenibacillus sp. F411]MBO2944883.1 carbohydrate ABC transporter permease [Paenibacillus sp. F411]
MKQIRMSRGDRFFFAAIDVFLLVALLVVLYPIIYIISSSISSTTAVISGKVWLWPVDFSLEGYKAIFKNNQIMTGYGNTIFYTAAGTIINVGMTILAAYPLSRKEFRGRNLMMLLFVFTMLFQAGLIPTYLTVKDYGLIDTRWAMLLPSAISVFNIIIARTYYQSTISDELYEAAQLDGCNHLRFMYHIVLPLSKAITAVLVLFYAVHHWNSFFDALIYLSDRNLFPLQIILRDILVSNSIDPSMITDPELMAQREGLADLLKYSLIIVASLPVWIAYPFVQKYFVKGVMIGSVKG